MVNDSADKTFSTLAHSGMIFGIRLILTLPAILYGFPYGHDSLTHFTQRLGLGCPADRPALVAQRTYYSEVAQSEGLWGHGVCHDRRGDWQGPPTCLTLQ